MALTEKIASKETNNKVYVKTFIAKTRRTNMDEFDPVAAVFAVTIALSVLAWCISFSYFMESNYRNMMKEFQEYNSNAFMKVHFYAKILTQIIFCPTYEFILIVCSFIYAPFYWFYAILYYISTLITSMIIHDEL